MLYFDMFGQYGIICTCACMFRNFYLSVLGSLLVHAAGNTFPNSTMKYYEKLWNFFEVNKEDTNGTSVFLKISMSLRSFWWKKLYVNLFQHLSFHNLFHLVHGVVHDEVNTCTF